MKKQLGFIVLLATGIMSSAFASSPQTCGQADTKFIQVLTDYESCNSRARPDQVACNRFCDEADKMMGSYQASAPAPATVQAYCAPEDLRNARDQGVSQGRQQGRDEVIRDLSVREDYVSPEYFGINLDDCGKRAEQSSQSLRQEAINRCNNKATSIKNCFIQSEKVVGSAGRPPRFEGSAKFNKDDDKSTEEECRKTSLLDATNQALKRCLDATGNTCELNKDEINVSHALKKPRIMRIGGKRDDRICEAKVVAEAPKDLSFKCNVRISARNQVSAN